MQKVSVIVPCLNEEKTIALLLKAIMQQTYPLQNIEVIIADGSSTDNTRSEIASFQEAHNDLNIQVIDNPTRSIPTGLNLAIDQASGDIILRLDAHCAPDSHYIAICVADLENEKAWNVGGLWDIQAGAKTWVAASIAIAAAHPIGIGDARYRFSNKAQFVDTVPFGSFRKSLIDRIGPFDEALQANEDYEFNTRIRSHGGQIWFNPAIRSRYFARPTFSALAKQYFRYGFWKWRMLQRFPKSIRWRQALPPLFVAGLIFGPILALWWPSLIFLWGAAVVSYVSLLLFIGLQKSLQKSTLNFLLGIPTAIMIMHLSFGSAFIWSMIQYAVSKN